MKDHTETLKVGMRAPEFLLEAANRGGIMTLSGFLRRGTLILEFMRGTWCPNCVKRMAEIETLKGLIGEAELELAYIAAEKRDGIFKPEKYFEKNPVSFPFLLDEDRAVTRTYGLYHRLGIDAINIAHPATLVIDASRIIRYIHVGETQSERAPIDQVFGAVDTMNSPSGTNSVLRVAAGKIGAGMRIVEVLK